MITDYVTLSLLLLTLIAMVGSIIYLWRRRSQKGARLFALYQVVAAGVLVTIIGSALSADNEGVFFWMRMRAPFQIISVVMFLLFALDYTGHTQWLSASRVIPLMIIPVILSLLSLNPNTVHYVVDGVRSVRNVFLMYEVSFDRVAGYWIGLVYGYAGLMITMALFLRHALKSQAPIRWQSWILFIVSVITLAFHFLNVLPFLPDISPNPIVYGLLARATIITWALFVFGLFDLMPIALQSVFERLPIGLIVLDVQGKIVEINPVTVNEAKRDHKSLLGLPLGDVFPPLGRFIELVPIDKDYSEEFEGDSASGEKRYFEAHHVPLYDKRGRIAGRLLTVRDITRRKMSEIERETLIDTLDSYAHTVAHDLKNPIALVLGYSTLLKDELGTAFPSSQMYLKAIIDATNRNVRIIDDLLLFASVRKGGDIPIHHFEMRPTLNEALARVEMTAANKEMSPQIRVLTDIPDAIGFPLWVEEIWVNYLSNAIKYGGKPPRVEVGAAIEGKFVRYWVHDNGDGLSEEEQDRLFHAIGRLEKHRHIVGHGLGLTICARIAERLGGKVGVESAIDMGSTFWFTLPRHLSPNS